MESLKEDFGMNESFLNWAAGFFEGEGHASIQLGNRTGSYQIAVRVINNDLEPIKLFHSAWDGRLEHKRSTYRGPSGELRRGKVSHRVAFRMEEGKKLLEDLLPYFRAKGKREAATIVLEAIRFPEKREELYGKLRELETYRKVVRIK